LLLDVEVVELLGVLEELKEGEFESTDGSADFEG